MGLLLPFASWSWAGTTNGITWVLDLLTHWQWAFVIALIPSLLVLGIRCRRFLLLIPMGFLPLLSASAIAPETNKQGDVLTVLSANIRLRNTDPAPFIAWLSRVQPDIVVLVELPTAFTEAIEALSEYPYQELLPQDDPFGIGVISRIPLEEILTHQDEIGIPRLEMTVRWKQQPLKLFAIHPMPPLSPEFQGHRNKLLQTLSAGVQHDRTPTIVAGDLNATPWSSAFAGLNGNTLLRATGLAPTWPSIGQGVIGIPIDHVLVSAHWRVADHDVGPDIGSDHYPVIVRLSLGDDSI